MVSVITETILLLGVYILNLPFGYWRRRTEKFSKEWIVAIHSPVPVVFLMRFLAGVSLIHIPFFVLSFFLGQLSGGKIRLRLEDRYRLSKCMVMDFIRIAKKHHTPL
jgi:hypothetical protein